MNTEEPITTFVSHEEDIKNQQTARVSSDPHSTEVVLMSAGKLSLPPRILVRDYNMDDATRLAMANNETILSAVLEVFKSIIQTPGINVLEMHEEEAKQVLLFILLNFWNSELERYPYEPNEEDLDHLQKTNPKRYLAVINKREDLWCRLRLVNDRGQSLVQMSPLAEEFKEPFKFKQDESISVSFRLARLGDSLIAQQRCDTELASIELALYDVKETMIQLDSFKEELAQLEVEVNDLQGSVVRDPEGGPDIVPPELEEKKEAARVLRDKIYEIYSSIEPSKRRRFEELQKEKAMRFLRYKQAASLVAINGKLLNSLDEKLEAYPRVSLNTWKDFAAVVRKYSFGIDSQLEVVSPITRRPVQQTVRFRILDLVPAVQTELPGEPTVVFGEI